MSLNKLNGLGQIRTLQNCKQRSIPLRKRSLDIEVYSLRKEKELFEAEEARLIKRLASVQSRIMSVNTEISKAEQEIMLRSQVSSKEKAQENKQQWKTKAIKY